MARAIFDRRYSETELQNPDFLRLQMVFGVPGEHLVDPTKMKEAVAKMLAHDGPYLLHVSVEKEGNVFPMIPSGASISDMRLE